MLTIKARNTLGEEHKKRSKGSDKIEEMPGSYIGENRREDGTSKGAFIAAPKPPPVCTPRGVGWMRGLAKNRLRTPTILNLARNTLNPPSKGGVKIESREPAGTSSRT